MRRVTKNIAYLSILSGILFLMPNAAVAQSATDSGSLLPDLAINIGGSKLVNDGGITAGLKIVALLTVLSFLPAMILTMTSFTRIAVVLGMTRTALGTQSLPPNTVVTGLALFLTIAIMSPVFQASYNDGLKPYMDGQMDQQEALKKSISPMKKFLIRHSRDKDIALFLEITHTENPATPEDLPLQIAIPAFVISELNTAFQIGFLIALPFLVLDMVVSSVLTTMSMITLPPVVISMPLKLMLFVIVDGWHLIISSVVKTYHTY